MKIIFLDVDGVLNTSSSLLENNFLCDDRIKLLKGVINQTSAQIVVSSSWRLYKNTLDLPTATLFKSGVEILDVTTDLERMGISINRSEEIANWVTLHKPSKFAILDDDKRAMIPNHFFQTNWKDGLTQEICDCLVRFFNE